MVCEGTLLLLHYQRKNGSWPTWMPGESGSKGEKGLDTYSRVHPTWVCTQALRDRDFKISNNDFWPPFIRKAMADVSFHRLSYKPTW